MERRGSTAGKPKTATGRRGSHFEKNLPPLKKPRPSTVQKKLLAPVVATNKIPATEVGQVGTIADAKPLANITAIKEHKSKGTPSANDTTSMSASTRIIDSTMIADEKTKPHSVTTTAIGATSPGKGAKSKATQPFFDHEKVDSTTAATSAAAENKQRIALPAPLELEDIPSTTLSLSNNVEASATKQRIQYIKVQKEDLSDSSDDENTKRHVREPEKVVDTDTDIEKGSSLEFVRLDQSPLSKNAVSVVPVEPETPKTAPPVPEVVSSLKAKQISPKMEFLNILLSLLSVIMTALSYTTLAKAATHVEPVLRNWQQKPLMKVYLVKPNMDCPVGSISNADTVIQWPGLNGIGCACTATSSSVSSSSVCNQKQIIDGCKDDPGIKALKLSTWRGSKICLEKGGQAVFTVDKNSGKETTRPMPDSKIPHQCPTGYRRCGRTSMDKWRATCTPASDLCPITLLASQSIFDYYGSGSASTLLSYFDRYEYARPKIEYYKRPENLYMAESSLVVQKQLPLVEFTVAFMHPNQKYPYLGPCNDDKSPHENTKSNYLGPASFRNLNVSSINFNHPDTCDNSGFGSVLDSRWKPYDIQDEADVFLDNFYNSGECAGLPAGDLNAALRTNYWASGSKCTTFTGAPIAMQCAEGITKQITCIANDAICENTFYQSRCGKLMHTQRQSIHESKSKIGLFTRNEIYWKEECESGYSDVKSNDSPLQRAIQAITALLALNITMNFLTIIVSVIVITIYEFNIDIPCIDGGVREDAAFLKMMTEKVSGVFKVIKLIPCIVALAYLYYVLDFYEEIASKSCSDPTTNQNFNAVGTTLPGAYDFCVITLIADCLHLASPCFIKLYRWCRNGYVTPVIIITDDDVDGDIEAETGEV